MLSSFCSKQLKTVIFGNYFSLFLVFFSSVSLIFSLFEWNNCSPGLVWYSWGTVYCKKYCKMQYDFLARVLQNWKRSVQNPCNINFDIFDRSRVASISEKLNSQQISQQTWVLLPASFHAAYYCSCEFMWGLHIRNTESATNFAANMASSICTISRFR